MRTILWFSTCLLTCVHLHGMLAQDLQSPVPTPSATAQAPPEAVLMPSSAPVSVPVIAPAPPVRDDVLALPPALSATETSLTVTLGLSGPNLWPFGSDQQDVARAALAAAGGVLLSSVSYIPGSAYLEAQSRRMRKLLQSTRVIAQFNIDADSSAKAKAAADNIIASARNGSFAGALRVANGGIAWAPDVTKIALAAYAAPVPPACREKFEHWCLDNSGLSNWGAIGIIIGGSVFVILALVLYIALCSCACCLKHEVEAAKKSQTRVAPHIITAQRGVHHVQPGPQSATFAPQYLAGKAEMQTKKRTGSNPAYIQLVHDSPLQASWSSNSPIGASRSPQPDAVGRQASDAEILSQHSSSPEGSAGSSPRPVLVLANGGGVHETSAHRRFSSKVESESVSRTR